MTPRTRSSNADASSKVYYSRKIPQQVHFPHKRKTVRRRSTPVQDEAEKQQMFFLPEKMRSKQKHVIVDSEDECGETEEEGIVDVSNARPIEQNKKRRRDGVADKTEPANKSEGPAAKRQRKTAASKKTCHSSKAEALSESEHDANPPETKAQKSDRRRRQSTMTQLVDGRRPLSDTKEPEFKAVKRSPRMSGGSRGKRKSTERDKKQRTLTQMVPGMRSFEVMSEDDMEEALGDLEAQEEDSQEYDDAVAQRLARQGLHRVESHRTTKAISDIEIEADTNILKNNKEGQDTLSAKPDSIRASIVESVEDTDEETEEESYHPTQYIDAPATRAGRNLRQRVGMTEAKSEGFKALSATSSKESKTRFALLRTPDKRRVREIPSSQSPAESPLSAQVSPQKLDRLPLKECSGNTAQAPETPSGRKNVTFQDTTSKAVSPPTLRRFQSTIQDSEDDDEDILDEGEPLSTQNNGLYARNETSSPRKLPQGKAVGANTQALLEQIDQACANADEDAAWLDRECSEDVDGHLTQLDSGSGSIKLESNDEYFHPMAEREASEECPHLVAQTMVKMEPSADASSGDLPVNDTLPSHQEQNEDGSPSRGCETPQIQPPKNLPATPLSTRKTYPSDTLPSTPMVILDDSSDEEADPIELTPPTSKPTLQSAPPTAPHSAGLDSELFQVPASPVAQEETQQSHSSKAEQQLQSEWFSYSQYLENRPPQQSSMHVGHDPFSYIPASTNMLPSAQKSQLELSQATTVDEVTPKKNRTQKSMNVTPHNRVIASSPTYSISPIKPPPLFIPSSFPSPGEVGMENWSSSALGKTQDGYAYLGSLEDMSIPPPPPAEDD